MTVFRYTSDNSHTYQHNACISLLTDTLCRAGLPVSGENIYKAENGKPFLDCPPYNISLSHCKGLICCMFSSTPCGIDCEAIRSTKKHERVIRRVFTNEEQDIIYSASDPDREFTRLWTLKEAYVKMTGTGIADISSIPFSYIHREMECYGARFCTYFLEGHIISTAVKTEP